MQQTQATVSTQDAANAPQPAHQTRRWIWFTVQQARAAQTLGYNELGWDEGVTPDQIAGRYWHELTGVLQAAAQILDYTEDLWNEELAQMLSDTETAAGE